MVAITSTSSAYQNSLAELMASENREMTAQQQVSTGKIGDNLSGFGTQAQALVATQTVAARVGGLVSQLNQTTTALTFQQTALTQVLGVASSLQQALTTALGEGTGDNLMSTVQSLFSQATDALNTQYNGNYIFSGGQTSTQPFAATSLTDLTTQPSVTSFFQNGTLTPTTRVDDTASIPTGFLATDVGQQLMSVFQSIQAFQQSGSGNFGGALTTAQQSFITSALSQMTTVEASTSQTTAEGGDIQSQIQTALTTQQDRQTTLTSVLGQMSDADMAVAASNLTQAQTAVQASAQVFNALKGMSLLNYLSTSSSAIG